MKILFAKHLDACPPPPDWCGVGKMVCGPMGLLTMLEQALGLAPVMAVGLVDGQGAPVLQGDLGCLASYRELLREYLESNPDAFFAQSFAAESLSTAGTLLHWRDELRLAGWLSFVSGSGSESTPDLMPVDEKAPSRLRTLAEIEHFAASEDRFKQAAFVHDQAAQLRRIIDSLEKGWRSGIESLLVIEEQQALPLLWRRLFEHLAAKYDPCLPTEALAARGTALHWMQDHLLGGQQQSTSDFSADDGSVVMLSEFSEARLAQAAAHRWRDDKYRATATLIAPLKERARLNEALHELDLPLLAAKPVSISGTLQQLAVLTLRLHWTPFDPQAWLEFLLHPVCPLPSIFRYRLADAINRTPGRANADWSAALDRVGEKLETYPDDKKERIQQQIDSWLNLPGFDPQEGAAGEVLCATLSTLAQWMAKVGRAKTAGQHEQNGDSATDHEAEAATYIAASREIRSFAEVLASMEKVTRAELERLLVQWLPSTSSGSDTSQAGELGNISSVTSPAQLLSPCDHVNWWNPSDAVSSRSPWLSQERDYLQKQGAPLVEAAALLRADDLHARRAVLYATQSLTLFSPMQAGGEGASSSLLGTRLLAVLGSGIEASAMASITTAELRVSPLPKSKRWWRIGDGSLLLPRPQESYTSIIRLIHSPYQWVLDYQAKLRKGRLFDYRGGDSVARRGTLLHDLAEKLFVSEPGEGEQAVPWAQFKKQEDLQQYLDKVWPDLLHQRGAQYLLPANEFAGKALLHTAQQTLWKLVRIFQEAEVSEIEVEKYIKDVPFVGGKLSGHIDLVLKSPAGMAVVDLKLGGKVGKTKELEENRHLQLALYGYLLRQTQQVESSTAFYIFSNGGELLTRTANFFPTASPVFLKNNDAADSGASEDSAKHGAKLVSEWSDCWQDFEQIWDWRWAQLSKGRVEVTVGGTEPDPHHVPPLEHWATPEGADRYNNFDAITGWS